jgi:hypothetical protein
MTEVTFAFDCQLNNDEDFMKQGQKVTVVTTGKQYDGFIKVRITDAYSYNDEPIQFVPFSDHFLKESFIELRD